jgi:hypothetical protein
MIAESKWKRGDIGPDGRVFYGYKKLKGKIYCIWVTHEQRLRYKEQNKARQRKYWSSANGKAAEARRAESVKNARKKEFPMGMRSCVECRIQYHTPDILNRGWRLVGDFGCICDLCEY